ncbi:MAG: ribonuclease [Lachnospiraceae bacterium]|nr:ribonuclease [Lachnospiraceae bacterium]
MRSKVRAFFLSLILVLSLLGTGCTGSKPTAEPDKLIELPTATVTEAPKEETSIDEGGTYDSAEDVALYLHTYGKLPSNYITKKEAQKLGWEGGSVEQVAPGKCIGGDWYGNYEGLLPAKEGREYHECDIDTLGEKKRGARRIIYSNDGLIYYTEDHYESFTLLYGEE